MDILLESSGRTLVIFDSVCSGLAECLALVHADIKHMSEHRNKLAADAAVAENGRLSQRNPVFVETNLNADAKTFTSANANARVDTSPASDATETKVPANEKNNDDDPHHLARLKLLDRRLADSFSQALSMCDQQKLSLDLAKVKDQRAVHTLNVQRSSIFQVLLGKVNKRSLRGAKATATKTTTTNYQQINDGQLVQDARTIIDDINMQTRLAMQYSKQLESNLLKVEDLRLKYEMHIKMGNAARSVSPNSLNRLKRHHSSTMMVNERSSLGRRSSLSTLNLNIDNIERVEAEFESYMGSFLLEVKDIQGFARVCQGDVFEISIKCGDLQKFKTKISVLKDNRQKCENKQTVFKARIADVIAIKAYECKGLGKRLLLGNKLCETRDLFTARSQLMTISLNQTGSIKLNLVITWNPLHMSPKSMLALKPGHDISHISLPPTPVSSSTLSSVSSANSSMNGAGSTTMISIQSSRNSGGGSCSNRGKHKVIVPAAILQQQSSPHFVMSDSRLLQDDQYYYSNNNGHQEHQSHFLNNHHQQYPHDHHNNNMMSLSRDRPRHFLGSDAIDPHQIPEPDYFVQ